MVTFSFFFGVNSGCWWMNDIRTERWRKWDWMTDRAVFPLFLWRKRQPTFVRKCERRESLRSLMRFRNNKKIRELQSASDLSFWWRIQALMEFKTTTNRRLSNAASTGLYGTGGGGGASRLSLYQVAPCVEVSIEEFEQFALDRLRGASFFLSSAALSAAAAAVCCFCFCLYGNCRRIFQKEKKRKENGVAVCMSVVEDWFWREEFIFSFFFDRSFLVGSSESHWGESGARKETWRSGSCGMCCCCSCLGSFFFGVYIAMIVICTMWLDGWWWPLLSILIFALATPFNNFQNASRVCRRAARIQMIFMLARVCTHFVKQKPLKPLKPCLDLFC